MVTIKKNRQIKITENNKCWQGCEETVESLCTVDENLKGYSHYGKQYGDFFKKLKIELPIRSSNSNSGYLPKKKMKAGSQIDICIPTLKAALLTTELAKRRKQQMIDNTIYTYNVI